MDPRFMPEVLQAVPGEGYTVYAYFNDGTVHHYDVSPLIQKGGVFAKIHDWHLFRSCLTVLNGTVAWDLTGNHDETDCIDIDPLVVYEAPEVDDPLEKTTA